MNTILYNLRNKTPIRLGVFEGSLFETLPNLIEMGYSPISIKQVMEQRIISWQLNDLNLIYNWESNHFNTLDTIIYNKRLGIKIVNNSQSYNNINSKKVFFDELFLEISEENFKKIDAEEFSRKDIWKFSNKYLTEKEVVNNPLWLAFAQHDKVLLKEYANYFYSRINNPFNVKHPQSMCIWICRNEFSLIVEKSCSIYGIKSSSSINYDKESELNPNSFRFVAIPSRINRIDYNLNNLEKIKFRL